MAVSVFCILLAAGPAALTYEKQLDSRTLRDAYFLGAGSVSSVESFSNDYERNFLGGSVERIAIITPFKEMVDRVWKARRDTQEPRTPQAGGRIAVEPQEYDPVRLEAEYKRQPPPLAVEVTPAPPQGPAAADVNYWQKFDVRLIQENEIQPLSRRAVPIYGSRGPADRYASHGPVARRFVIRLIYNPDKVASGSTRIVVTGPDGQEVEAYFDLGRLR